MIRSMILCATSPADPTPGRAALPKCPLTGLPDDSTRESPDLAQLTSIKRGGFRQDIRNALAMPDVCGHERDAGHGLTLRIGSMIVEAIGVVAVLVQLS